MGQHQWCPLKQLLLATAPPRSPDQTSSENWYYANGKQKLGPFSLPQFKQLAASGTLKPDDMVWREGSAVWVKAGSVADLFSPNLDETRQNNPLQFAVQTPESLPYGDRSKIEKEANPSHLLVDVAKPSLWNPSVASAWSLLLTPIFGAVLHALNWRELRHQNRQLGNIAWAVLYASFLLLLLVSLLVSFPRPLDVGLKGAPLALLLAWYYSLGRSQEQFVTESLQGGYLKRSWAFPLACGAGGVLGYLSIALVVGSIYNRPTPSEIAATVKPLILQEWQKDPATRNATIQSIELTHKGGNEYVGYVKATIGGQQEQLLTMLIVRWKLFRAIHNSPSSGSKGKPTVNQLGAKSRWPLRVRNCLPSQNARIPSSFSLIR